MRKPLLSAALLAGFAAASVAATASPAVVSSSTPQATAAASHVDGARSRWEISCNIRKDKFDFVLPRAMRANNIDMWIVIDRGRGTQPMTMDFSISTINGQGFFVFIDRGGDRIERLQLGGETDLAEACGAYDEFRRRGDLRSIVLERDPQRIALNYLELPNSNEGQHVADGLTHTDFKFLSDELGEPYASRFVSAQRLIADFRGERVALELVEFSKVANLTGSYIERALSNEVITPGVTTHNDVSWWLEEQRERMGLLRTGETEVPAGIQNAFDEAVRVRRIIRNNVRAGRTGREQLDALKQIIRDAGYVYTEQERASDVEGIEVNVGMHAAGNIGHDMAASLFEIFPIRTEYMVRPNNIISLEYIVFTPAPEWNGAKVPVNVEENAVITERGIEWLYPPQMRVQVIR